MATEITQRIRAYRDGDGDWPQLRDWLASYKYKVPDRYKGKRDDPLMEPDSFNNDDGTWDEVHTAFYMGLLTDAEYFELSRLVQAREPAR